MSDNAQPGDPMYQFTDDEFAKMEQYLDDNGHGTLRAFALDSGYVMDDPEYDSWIDENGNPVNLWVQLWWAIDAAERSTGDWL